MAAAMAELKAAISEALQRFGRGDLGAPELRTALADLGVDMGSDASFDAIKAGNAEESTEAIKANTCASEGA